MNYVTGTLIKELREKKKMTQKELADTLLVSDKTVSKWETGKGLPDIGILEDLAAALGISVADLLTGEYRENDNVTANMKRAHFYVCPVCGNIITSVGTGSFSCCGITLPEAEAETEADENHTIRIEQDGYDLCVSIDHAMSKKHYISFIAYMTGDSVEIRKMYPEQEPLARFFKRGHGKICAFCNRHGMFGNNI